MTAHPIEAWKPDWMVCQDVVENTDRSLGGDSVKNTRPIHQAAETRAEIEQLFDGIAYGKSAAVLHMLESYLGHDTFRAGVNLYLKEHAYGNATAADFWSAMARGSKKPIDKIMPTFVMQPGAPYVGVEAKCEGGNTTLNLSQKRYFDTPAAFNAAQRTDLADSGLRQGPQRKLGGPAAMLPADPAATAVQLEGLFEVRFPRFRCAGLLPLRLRQRRPCANWATRWRRYSLRTNASR